MRHIQLTLLIIGYLEQIYKRKFLTIFVFSKFKTNKIKNMIKKIILRKSYAILALSVTLAVALPLAACAKELPLLQEPTGIITMTTQSSKLDFIVGIAGADKFRNLTIDWGDGEESKFTDAASSDTESGSFLFSHRYSGASEYRITITGDNIERLDFRRSQLTALDVSRNRALTVLWCQHNPLTNLDVSKNTALEELEVGGSGNQLTILDVSKNTALRRLHIASTQIKNLDVSKNHALTYLICRYNQLTTDALNEMFRTLTDKSVPVGNPNPIKVIHIIGNPGTDDCDRSIAEKKGWYFRGDSYKEW